ncbi:MAG: hypothetical protein J2P21_12060 [Chloracidobacterium sp.]|nr:hypothetical protein [Chloracidobacterium sp.]
MMKRILSIALFTTMLVSLGAIANAQDANKDPNDDKNSDDVIIPAGKLAKLSLQTQLSTKITEVNDEVSAVLYAPVNDEYGHVILPRGIEFTGRVTQVQAAKRPQKESTMTIVFDTMVMSYGTEKVSVTVTAIDDYANDEKLKSKNDEGKVGGGHSGERTVRNAGIGGGIGGLGGIIASGAGGGIGAVAGSIGVGAAGGVLMTKGKDIRLEPGTILRIKFERPVKLPASEIER